MAKISGGRNMFGMMGMPTPFGAPPQRTPSTKKRDTAKESSSNTVTSHQRESVPPASEPPTSPISKSVSQRYLYLLRQFQQELVIWLLQSLATTAHQLQKMMKNPILIATKCLLMFWKMR